jgi:cholesterol transport system auxiliary component
MKNLYWLTLVLFTFLLSSCSIFSAPADPKTKYVLNTVPCVPVKKQRGNIVILVPEPHTISVYNTPQIAYSTAPYQISYFSKNTWASHPAEMMQPLIIQALQNTHYFRAVMGQSIGGGYNYTLNTEINELLQDYSHQIPLLRLTVRAQIVRLSNSKIIASKEFVVVTPILQKSPCGGVYAANLATAEMLRQLTQFCLKNI